MTAEKAMSWARPRSACWSISTSAWAEGRWEFMITVTPLRLANETGSPVNPIAVF